MKKIEDGREEYENIQIPEELYEMVKKTIAEHPQEEMDRLQMEKRKKGGKTMKRNKIIRYCTTAAAALAACFTIALNTSEVFAKEAGELPFIGGLARVLTVRSYESHENGVNIKVDMPAVDVNEQPAGAGTGTDETAAENKTEAVTEESAAQKDGQTVGQLAEQKQFTGDINAEIEKITNEFVAKAEQDFAEYKEAFFATGGTEEEWADREMDVKVDYEVKYQKGSVLSLKVELFEGWVAAYAEQHYYNLDLSTNKQLTLADMLGESFKEIADEQIIAQMHERAEKEGFVYWGVTDDGEVMGDEAYNGVDENTSFYINENGNPVVCYGKYEVGPGYMGVQEFEIQK